VCGFIDTGISKLPNGCDVPAEDPNLPKVEWRVTSVRTSGRFPSPVDALLTKNKTTVSQVVQGIGVMSFCWGYLTDKAMNLPAAIVITTTSVATYYWLTTISIIIIIIIDTCCSDLFPGIEHHADLSNMDITSDLTGTTHRVICYHILHHHCHQ